MPCVPMTISRSPIQRRDECGKPATAQRACTDGDAIPRHLWPDVARVARSRPRSGGSVDESPFRSLRLVLAITTSVLVVVAAVVALATTTWQVVPIAVLLEAALLVGVVIYTYSVMRSATQAPQAIAEPTCGSATQWPRTAPHQHSPSSYVTRTPKHEAHNAFSPPASRAWASVPADDETRALKVLIERQRELAAAHEVLLDDRLNALGKEPSRLTTDEAMVAAWLFERLLDPNCATQRAQRIRAQPPGHHLLRLAARLAETTADHETQQLMQRCGSANTHRDRPLLATYPGGLFSTSPNA